MNKNKIIIVAIVVILIIIGIVIILTFGSKAKVITPEEFEQKAKDQGFTIGEIDNLVTQSKPVKATKMAISADSSYYIEMYVLEDEKSADEFYNEKKQNYEELKSENDKGKEVSKSNYKTYTLKSNGNCMYVKRIDNTLISYIVKEANEQKVNEFVNSL